MRSVSYLLITHVASIVLFFGAGKAWSYSGDRLSGEWERARSIEKKQLREAIETFEISSLKLKKLKLDGVNFDQVIFSYQRRYADSPTYDTVNCKPVGYAFFCSNNNENARNDMLYDKIEVLLEMGCDPQQFKGDILFRAVMVDRVELARMLLQRGVKIEKSLVFSGGYWQPLLHLAALHASKEMVELLLSYGFDKNDKDRNGTTPLHYALTRNGLKPTEKNQAIIDLLNGAPFKKDPGVINQESSVPATRNYGSSIGILVSGILIVLGIGVLIKKQR